MENRVEWVNVGYDDGILLVSVHNLLELEDAFFAKLVDCFLANNEDCDFVNFEESLERRSQVGDDWTGC